MSSNIAINPNQLSVLNCEATPLHMAAAEGNIGEIVRLVTELKIDPNILDKRRRTPLEYAAEKGHTAAIETLIELGANPNSREGFYNRTTTENLKVRESS